ncbi:MAG TPA: HDIG domain-containing protein [Thermoplasmatales archaeon]|nr:HDIG domain-containing protein [Thermoplasmatales archaeon]
MISREEAIKIVSRVKNENLRKHMKAVASIMEKVADKLGEDKDIWWLTGLLHDIDYEIADYNEHGKISAEMLEGKLPDYALHAIKSHNDRTGFYPENKIDYALIACDAISGLIVASALVMPNKKVSEVKIETLKNKFKDKSFARKVDRNRIREYEKIGMSFDEFLSLALEGVKKISDELGL